MEGRSAAETEPFNPNNGRISFRRLLKSVPLATSSKPALLQCCSHCLPSQVCDSLSRRQE